MKKTSYEIEKNVFTLHTLGRRLRPAALTTTKKKKINE
jgi:hypothetical protein